MTTMLRNLIILAIIGFIASLPIIKDRVDREDANRSAEILFDYAALNDLARSHGNNIEDILAKCKENGVTSIAIEENSRDSLALRGLARTATYFELLDMQTNGLINKNVQLDPMCAYYVATDNQIAKKIAEGAEFSLGQERVKVLPDESGNLVQLRCDPRSLASLGVGVPLDVIEKLSKEYGFKVWYRPWNSPDISEEALRERLRLYDNLSREGQIEGLIFGGLRNEVYGYPNQLDLVADLIKETNLKLGVIELAPKAQQLGVVTLAKKLQDHVVRVMAISSAHQSKLLPEAVVSMYDLGVRERNIRLIYCRPYLDGVKNLSLDEANTALLEGLQAKIIPYFKGEADLFRTATPVKPGFTLWSLAIILMGMGIVASGCMILNLLKWPFYKYSYWIVGAVSLVVALSSVVNIGLHHMRLLLALAGITIYPILGFVIFMPLWEKAENSTSLLKVLVQGWSILLGIALSSLASGLLVAGLLSDTTFMLSLDVFRGVKAHGLLVPVCVFIIWLIGQHKKGGLNGVIQFLNSQVKLWHVIAFALLLAMAAFYLIRTGNAGGDLVVSDSERVFRRWLDVVLGVRPRFKEFLLGNPALIMLPTLLFIRWRSLVPLFILAGSLGMASLADTYAHIHTPLLISLQRTFNGLLIGGILGTLGSLVIYEIKELYLKFRHE